VVAQRSRALGSRQIEDAPTEDPDFVGMEPRHARVLVPAHFACMTERPMTDKTDHGVLFTLVEHFNQQLYPRALEIEKRLDAGERLSASAIEHLSEVLARMRELNALLERHPEYLPLAAGVVSLYARLTRHAWQNEQGAAKP
jgi:hypothetical protein